MRRIVFVVAILTVLSERLDPDTIPKFETNLSLSHPAFKHSSNMSTHRVFDSISVQQITQQMLPVSFPKTTVYAYGGSCYDPISGSDLGVVHTVPGPTFLIPKNTQITTTWANLLTGKHMFAIQKNLDFMYDVKDFDNFIPTIAHAHGMANPTFTDGNAEAWFTVKGQKGNQYYSQNLSHVNMSTITWINEQEEGTLLYHDHSMAMTRLNFYAGLHGFLIIQDPDSPLSKSFDKNHDIFLAISSASFNQDGSLYYPSQGVSEVYPVWVPEFYGDMFVVNGKVWPNLNVESGLYRVRLLNVCNSLGLLIAFVEENSDNYIPFKLFKADISYYEEPLVLDSIQLPVSGRAEIVIDFSLVKTKRLIMKHIIMGPNQHHHGNLKQHNDKAQDNLIMSFTPSQPSSTKIKLPTVRPLNPYLSQFPFPAPSVINKYSILVEVTDDFDQPIGTFIDGIGMSVQSDVFELSKVYDLHLINLTPDTHPMHIHLINFQYYKKADIDALKYAEDWYAANGGNPPYLKRPIIMVPDKYLASDWEKLDGVKRVFRDVDNVEPHTVAVFRFRFRHNNGQPFSFNTRIGEYIWHCHILEHEDNEMMRPFVVQ